ncbi:hypothetical protein WSS_A28265 [Rhodococcus opacus M213]|uniref:Uncharacterized protein n=1 Tax=Rhodococcus opacus M213 TaxID=1129896 RepID=K8XLV4_RHOOP|nr:hypothetical protein WSS_A28265 [Rhodococcus opacus M213]
MGETFLGICHRGVVHKRGRGFERRNAGITRAGIRNANENQQRETDRTGAVSPARIAVCEEKSTTVDVGDCEHADSDQRQFMADLVYSGFGHAVDCSRG